MNWKKIISISLVTCLLTVAIPLPVLADSINEIKKEETRVQKEGEAINKEIDSVVETINKKYQVLAKIEEEISESETKIEKTETEIDVTTESIEKRSEVMAARLQEMQLRQTTRSSLVALLEAESFSDLMNRAYAVNFIQQTEREKVEALYADKERLAELKETLAETQTKLISKQATAEAEKDKLDIEVSGLQNKLAKNKKVLAELTKQRIAAAERQEAEKKLKEEELKKNKKAVVSAAGNKEPEQDSNKNQTQTDTNPTPQQPTIPIPPSTPEPSGGSSGQATAYTATGNKTATGTVPATGRTIAVDPRVVPLGARVQIIVPSMPAYSGVYVAEDTGGAIKGNIIDIFVGGHGEATIFGRRAIFFTVLG